MRDAGNAKVPWSRTALAEGWLRLAITVVIALGAVGGCGQEPAREPDAPETLPTPALAAAEQFVAYDQLWERPLDHAHKHFLPSEVGRLVHPVSDLDGDAIPEILAGIGMALAYGISGGVAIFSGADGTLLEVPTSWPLPDRFRGQSFEHIGTSLGDVGDIDGDGLADYAVGAPTDFGEGRHGRVLILSGASHDALRVLQAGIPNDRFGEALALLEDVDGDGLADLAIGAPGHNVYASEMRGRVYAYSLADGADGQPLWQHDFPPGGGTQLVSCAGHGLLVRSSAGVTTLSPDDGRVLHHIHLDPPDDHGYWPFNDDLVCLQDVNGDGVHDIALRMTGSDPAEPSVDDATLWAIDGRTEAILWRMSRTWVSGHIGDSVITVSDVDGDGIRDVATTVLADPQSGFSVRVIVVSGATGLRVTQDIVVETSTRRRPGLCSLGDLNGDGLDELVLGIPHDRLLAFESSRKE